MKSKLTILSLDNSFTFGGAINSLSYMVKALDKDQITFVLISAQKNEILEKLFPNITYYRIVPKLPWINKKFYKFFDYFQNSKIKKIVKLFRFVYWLIFIYTAEVFKYYIIVRRHQVNLLHFNNGFEHLPWIILSKILRIRCISHMRGFAANTRANKFYARLINHHIAISEATKNNLLQFGVPESRITLIYDAIDLSIFSSHVNNDYIYSEFKINKNNPIFGIFGRIVYWKGIKEFIYATNGVRKIIPSFTCFVVGDISDGSIEYFEKIKNICTALDLEDHIIFTGYRSDVPELISVMDVVVHASITPEPFGMVIIEAMAMSKPVIATAAGGPLDIVVNGETGFLVEIGNIDQMSKTIVKLLKNVELAHKMGVNGRLRVEMMFTNNLYASKMEKVFYNLSVN
jgi:glycosyltransferase involved in cell wall biosynthesis